MHGEDRLDELAFVAPVTDETFNLHVGLRGLRGEYELQREIVSATSASSCNAVRRRLHWLSVLSMDVEEGALRHAHRTGRRDPNGDALGEARPRS